MHTGIYSISMTRSIDGSESGLIGIPLGWGLYGPEPECTVVELSGEFKLGPTRCVGSSCRRLEPMRQSEFY